MPESQQPASVENQSPVPMSPNTVTEPLLAEAPPSPKRRRAPAKRKPRTKAKAAGAQQRTAVHVVASKTVPSIDLYDRLEQRIRNSGTYMRDNVMNAVVASGVVLLIVLAHWATQQEISTASVPVAVTSPAEVASPATQPATEPNPPVSPIETITATATVEEPADPPPAESQPAESPPDVTATATVEAEKPVVDTPSQPVVPTGTVIETSVSIRAPLEPAKPLSVVEPVVEAAPPAQTLPPVVRRAPALRHRRAAPVRVTAAQVPAALLNDPYTNGGATDLDAPTVRQHYLQQNHQTMKSLSASRTE